MREQIDRIVAQGKLDLLTDFLEGAKVEEYRYAARRVAETTEPGDLLERAAQLATDTLASKHLACQLLLSTVREDPKRTFSLLQTLAQDENWTVRDAAGEACGRLLRKDFPTVLDRLRHWQEHRSPSVRRAVITASVRAAHPRHLERAEPLLKLLEPLLSDGDEPLRRALGPSALAMHLLRHYPTMTFEYLVKWSTSNDPQVLWNVAMAFTGQPAAPLAKKALIVLRKLSLDERRYVWRAVSSAMWRLGRKRPEIVRPELVRWLEDERRVDVAREALKHL